VALRSLGAHYCYDELQIVSPLPLVSGMEPLTIILPSWTFVALDVPVREWPRVPGCRVSDLIETYARNGAW